MTLLKAASNFISYGTTANPEHAMGDQEEEDRLLYPHSVYEPDNETGDGSSIGSDVQDGVRKIEAINLTWTQRSLMIAYLG